MIECIQHTVQSTGGVKMYGGEKKKLSNKIKTNQLEWRNWKVNTYEWHIYSVWIYNQMEQFIQFQRTTYIRADKHELGSPRAHWCKPNQY